MVLTKGWSQDACRKVVTKMIIMGELLLSFVDNKGFKHFCNVVVPQFVMSSQRTIDIMDLYLEEKTMLKSLIYNNKRWVTLTTDVWVSVQNMSYMVIDRCLNMRIISFSVIEDHRGNTIDKKTVTFLQDWRIEMLFAITANNATTNDVVCKICMCVVVCCANFNVLSSARIYYSIDQWWRVSIPRGGGF